MLGLLGVLGAGYVSTLLLKPARLARADSCIGLSTANPPFGNTCDSDINLQYCLFSKAGPAGDICRNTLLKPGEGVTDLDADLARLGGLFRVDMMACKTPYLPGEIQDQNNKRMKPACLSKAEPGVGPHILRYRNP